jgi:hypothetical protein
VKTPFQVLHLIREVFQSQIAIDNIENVNFAEFDEAQNRALYTIKTLMTKLTKE